MPLGAILVPHQLLYSIVEAHSLFASGSNAIAPTGSWRRKRDEPRLLLSRGRLHPVAVLDKPAPVVDGELPDSVLRPPEVQLATVLALEGANKSIGVSISTG